MQYPLEVIWTFMLDYTRGWGVRRHQHDYFQMYYCVAGEGTMLLHDQNITLQQNDCLIIRPEQIHELYPIKSGQLRVIDTKFYVHDEELKSALLEAPQLIQIPGGGFGDIQQNMRNEWVSGTLYAKDMVAALFLQSILIFLRDNVRVSTQPPFYRKLNEKTEHLTGLEGELVQYLQTHFLEELPLDRIAEDMHYSKNYLCKIFKASCGMTITEYVNCLRIRKAYDLVCCTESRLTEIGVRCGFSSIHYFSRTFRRITGMTPTQARDQDQNRLRTDIRLHGTFRYRYYQQD